VNDSTQRYFGFFLFPEPGGHLQLSYLQPEAIRATISSIGGDPSLGVILVQAGGCFARIPNVPGTPGLTVKADGQKVVHLRNYQPDTNATTTDGYGSAYIYDISGTFVTVESYAGDQRVGSKVVEVPAGTINTLFLPPTP
jgi:hypothetical protein